MPSLPENPANREELITFLGDAHERGILDADSLGMLVGAIKVADMQVRDAMIPRGQMVCIRHEESAEDLLAKIVESGHSRFPVIKDDKDEVIGTLLAKDLLKHASNGSDNFDVTQLMRKPVFIPESKRLNVLLKEFRAKRNHMAVVLDEYGGVSGLITIEDVLEEIVGDIDDEHDTEDVADIVPFGDGKFTVMALTTIEDFNTYFKTGLSDDEFDTIGGYLTGQLGRLPEHGEHITLDAIDFEILRADNRRLLVVGVTLPTEQEQPSVS